jgi:hypothetical protein
MKLAKQSILALAVTALSLASSPGQQIDLVSLGSPTFTVDPVATTAAYSQTGSGLVFNGTYVLADTVGGTFTSQDWSNPTYTTFGVVMSITGTNPDMPFSVQFYDSSFAVINTYTGTTSTSSLSPFQPLTLAIPGTGLLSDVAGIQFTWDGGGTINTTAATISAVPEPSTYALLALGASALGGYAVRRRYRA